MNDYKRKVRERFAQLCSLNTISIEDSYFPIIEEFMDGLIAEVREATLKEAEEVINEVIRISNDTSSHDWFDGLRCARESVRALTQPKES